MSGASLAAGHALGITAADWDTAAPQTNGMRAGVVADALKAGESLPGLRAVLVAHRGVLVAERYYSGADAEGLQPINSATKSLCSMLVGLALRDGRLKSLDDTVAQLLPDAIAEVPDSPARSVTLRQILCGRCGLAFDPMHFGQLAGAKPLVRYALSRRSRCAARMVLQRRDGRADRPHSCACAGCRLVRAGCSAAIRLDRHRALRVAARP